MISLRPPLAALALGTFIIAAGCSKRLSGPAVKVDRSLSAPEEPADHPQNFGFQSAWLAVKGDDPKMLIDELKLADVRRSSWKTGVGHAVTGYLDGRYVFVSDPIDGFMLAVGHLPDAGDANHKDECSPLLERLAKQYRDVQYFGNEGVTGTHMWARLVNGRVVRKRGRCEDQGIDIWTKASPRQKRRHAAWRCRRTKDQIPRAC